MRSHHRRSNIQVQAREHQDLRHSRAGDLCTKFAQRCLTLGTKRRVVFLGEPKVGTERGSKIKVFFVAQLF
jgi:hypothetical protein